MRQKQKKFKLDYREKEELYRKIDELGKSYTPEWRFTESNPDIGSVIGMIFAQQMEDNINRYNQVIYNYHTEFVNMLGVSLRSASPACATVLFTLAEDTIPGTMLHHGTKLYTTTEEEGEESVIFETAHDIYVTNSRLTDAYMVSGEQGTIYPLLGQMQPVSYVEPSPEEQEEAQAQNQISELAPFGLFHFDKKGIEKNALLFYLTGITDVENNDIYIRLTGNDELLAEIAAGNYRFLYYSEKGMLQVEDCRVENDRIILRKSLPNQKLVLEEVEYSLLLLESTIPLQYPVHVSAVSFSSAGEAVSPDYLGDAERESEQDKFRPFGEEIALFRECYIGQDTYLQKPGAVVKLNFHMDFEVHYVGMSAKQEEEELKPIRRKPRVVWSDTPADTWAEEIVIEYFNGSGWKRLNCDQDYRHLFATEQKGDVELTFRCPEDISAVDIGGYSGCCLRVQILRADNCYLQPCNHHYPVLRDCKISYSYEEKYQKPERCFAVYGTRKADLTGAVMQDERFLAFTNAVYAESALYLGFDKKFEDGPISLFYEMEEHANFEGMRLKYEYSSLKGFKPLKVADRTGMMTSSGAIMFQPPTDMMTDTIEGQERYWIKISPGQAEELQNRQNYPRIRHIDLNAMECYNIDTMDEEDYFMEESTPNMHFYLNAENILKAQIWVNESESFTEEQMNRMLLEQPDRIRVERDFLGNIDTFFVLWEEVPNFLFSVRDDRHYILDRMNSRVLFGDGIHVMIPEVTDGTAFKAIVSCCNGKAGNVNPGQINESQSGIMFVNNITNPLQAFGGSDIETVENALSRGGNILCGRHRLVSEYDYIREIRDFSPNIDKVKCITGTMKDGSFNESAINLVLLMKDFNHGSYSFHKEQGRLLEHLRSSCELVVTEEDIHIVEPVYLQVSVELWLEVPSMDDSFEIQNLFEKCLTDYLNPVSHEGDQGWEIGTLPRPSQIQIRLNTLKSKAVIQRMSVTAQYRDLNGTHETELKRMQNNPYVLCCNGRHQIHMQLTDL